MILSGERERERAEWEDRSRVEIPEDQLPPDETGRQDSLPPLRAAQRCFFITLTAVLSSLGLEKKTTAVCLLCFILFYSLLMLLI